MFKLFSATHLVALQKVIQALTGLGTALMVVHFLSPEEQGYFYTMGSLLSSYVVFDLGLSSYLLQRSAQISNGLIFEKSGKILPEGEKKNQFIAFVSWTFKWYRNAGVIALFVLGITGSYVLSHNGKEYTDLNWIWPWLLIVVAVAINMPSIGLLAILEGSGSIRETYLLRIMHYAIGALFAWVVIASGNGLYAQATPILATAAVCFGWFFYKYRANLARATKNKNKDIGHTILPQIKYTASTWLANYIFLNAPVILSFVSGQVIASGQLGLSIIIANVGGAVAMASVTSKMPAIIKKIDMRDHQSAKKIFTNGLKTSSLAYSFGSISLLFLSSEAQSVGFFSRLLPTFDLAILLLGILGLHHLNCLVMYLRACSNNQLPIPMLVFVAISILLSAFLLNFSTISLIITLSCSTLVLFIIALFLFTRKNRF